ncbi:MAG: preprotein translocase subunit SecA [bacterium]|nr:preprotein translocase subunit SecA [bacterium]
MLELILRAIFGTKQERDLKKLFPVVEQINNLENEFLRLSDQSLRDKTIEFKERLKNGSTFDDILPEAFAIVREAAKRTISMRHFDVQLIGGIVLHEGKIAEMKTGEGKTLVATLPIYLNALLEKGTHVVTVNDYLARRDAHWMGPIYEFLGLKVGIIQHDMDYEERKFAYNCDVTYGTNNEFGFDYLRDNMVANVELKVQREHFFAIVDEVDSILIDEARTPLIISGPTEESTDKYYKINRLIPKLKQNVDFQIDEKAKNASLTEDGARNAERLLGVGNLFSPKNMDIVHHIIQALKAHYLFKKDVDYIIKDGEVIIVDEFTGRLMPGRRYSEGLHQALEAKEMVKIAKENQTLATITFQNYFRLYEKLAGMTGTADTEAEEFDKIYNLEVIVIPTNEPMIRKDFPDVIYKTENEKFKAIASEIEKLYKNSQPVLVGTVSVEKSERLSKILNKKNIPHNVLNAKYHEKEAQIIALAGQKKAITIATNMAGRGTDIVLENGVVDLGGLHIIGTERHESRRIDNQLRGRSGRQGDPGSSRFYLSLGDDLMRLFGSDRISSIMERLSIPEDQPIEHTLISKAIERAQKQVESYNFDIRKRLIEYDDVMNEQRKIIYNERDTILEEKNLCEHLQEIIEEYTDNLISLYCNPEIYPDDWDIAKLKEKISQITGLHAQDLKYTHETQSLKEEILSFMINFYKKKRENVGMELIDRMERMIMLQVVDSYWKDHLYSMDCLKEGIGLRAYGQKDPLIEYKSEAYKMFSELISKIKEEIIEYIFKVEIAVTASQEHSRKASLESKETFKTKKIGRNDPCYCGSGKKYKHCHGK